MKIAVPTRGNEVDSHFGHCDAYTVFTIDHDNKVEKSELLPSPEGCGCKSNIAGVLQGMGVSVMLAGNMGDGALNVLNMHGIDVYRGCSGNVHQLVDVFLAGNVNDSGEGCHQHGEHDGGHQCNH
ncbi:MAG: NifB/NifX family molybdenum-iron cluster-binding protein [Bacteroidales bacterium]|nr:NifB/NifX family molybdenum-iron cluster-binding protein [Bacteroidales bacterium]